MTDRTTTESGLPLGGSGTPKESRVRIGATSAAMAKKGVELADDCLATLIPSGKAVVLHRGERVVVTQALGGSVTVQTDAGLLARISGRDAVALGIVEPPKPTVDAEAQRPFDEADVYKALATVFDPEIPVNVVDLGLIYGVDSVRLDDGTHRVEIHMSMTAPGCGMGDVLRDDALDRVAALPGVSEVSVELVWDPPWSVSRMSDAARLELGML